MSVYCVVVVLVIDSLCCSVVTAQVVVVVEVKQKSWLVCVTRKEIETSDELLFDYNDLESRMTFL